MSALVAAAPAPVREPPRLVNALPLQGIEYSRIKAIPQLQIRIGNGTARSTGTSGARAREVRRATREQP